MKTFILAALILNTSAFIYKSPASGCFDDLNTLKGQLVIFAASLAKDVNNPDLNDLKEVLASVSATLLDCEEITLDLKVYGVCVDKSQPAFTSVGKIVSDITRADFTSLSTDLLELENFIGSTLVPCFIHPQQFASAL